MVVVCVVQSIVGLSRAEKTRRSALPRGAGLARGKQTLQTHTGERTTFLCNIWAKDGLLKAALRSPSVGRGLLLSASLPVLRVCGEAAVCVWSDGVLCVCGGGGGAGLGSSPLQHSNRSMI